MHDYEKIVAHLEAAVAGEVTLAEALTMIDTDIVRPPKGPRWDYVATGIFGSLGKIASENMTSAS